MIWTSLDQECAGTFPSPVTIPYACGQRSPYRTRGRKSPSLGLGNRRHVSRYGVFCVWEELWRVHQGEVE